MSDTAASERRNRSLAIRAWGENAPDWVLVLADEIDRSSVRKIAARLGYRSNSVITETIRRRYKGRLDRVEAAVRGAFLGATVDCPVLGELPRDRCLAIQMRPFAATNPHRVLLARTCPTCEHCRAKNGAPDTPRDGDTDG